MRKIIAIFVMLVLLVSSITVVGTLKNETDMEKCNVCGEDSTSYGMANIPPRSDEILNLIDTDPEPTRSFDTIPSQFNWANYGGNWVTPVKDQAYPVYCGSCYIFAVWGAFEASINIKSGNPNTNIDLSEQYGLSCINSGCNGCGGGWGSTMLQNIVSTDSPGNGVNGVPVESCMPYQAIDTVPCSNKCSDWDFHTEPILDPDDKLWQIASWGSFAISENNPNDWDILKTYLMDYGPIAVSMYWSNGIQNFVENNHSPNDVYENDDSGYTNHLILCVGWVDDININGGGYWILKNSHGTSQGYGGFCNLAYGCLNLGVSECDWILAEEWPEEEQGPGPIDFDMAIFSDFNYESKYPHPYDEIEFSDISDGDVVLRQWDLNGDGIIDSDKKNPTWIYDQKGSYEVTLDVWNEWGLHNSRTRIIEVKQNWPAVVKIKPDQYPDPDDPKNDLEVHFDSRFSYDPDGSIVSYLWDFDDGTTSNEQYLYHTFPQADKTYEVRLTLTDNDGGTSSATREIKIDKTVPPVTEILHGYGSTQQDWYKDTQRISFSATDWTKVINTYYQVDEGSWTRYIELDQRFIPVSGEGMHTVKAYSVDFFNNEETPVTDIFGIDKTSPTVDVTLNGIIEDGCYANEVTIKEITGDDQLSGIKAFYYRYGTYDWIEFTGSTIINDFYGIFTLYYMAEDQAGNTKIDEQEIRITPKTPPTIPYVSGDKQGTMGQEYKLTVVSYDEGNDISYYIEWGDGEVTEYDDEYESGEPVEFFHVYESEGSYNIWVKAKNQYNAESGICTFDISIPQENTNFIQKFLDRLVSLIQHIIQQILDILNLDTNLV